jgi:hypothetical protein
MMQGTMIVIRPSGSLKKTPLDAEPSLETLKAGLDGGYLEAVPGFNQFPLDNGKLAPAVVYCDEDGKRKQLPINAVATQIWYAILKADGRPLRDGWKDYLVGNVVVLTGDQAFMRSLYSDGDDDDEQ